MTDNESWLSIHDVFERRSLGRRRPAGDVELHHPRPRPEAIRTVDHGVTVSLGYDLPIGKEPLELGSELTNLHEAGSRGVADVATVVLYGFAVTHMDALGHVGHEGHVDNGRRLEDVVSDRGLRLAR